MITCIEENCIDSCNFMPDTLKKKRKKSDFFFFKARFIFLALFCQFSLNLSFTFNFTSQIQLVLFFPNRLVEQINASPQIILKVPNYLADPPPSIKVLKMWASKTDSCLFDIYHLMFEFTFWGWNPSTNIYHPFWIFLCWRLEVYSC